jgi:hypothetical protein
MSLQDRNKPGGILGEIQMFNNLIIDLDLAKVPFSGKRYTWSNMKLDPLLVKLDWVLTSSTWALSFPETSVQPLSRPISDHIRLSLTLALKFPRHPLSDLRTTG